MTKHANRKQQARALVAELGISYTEALRRTEMQSQVLPNAATTQAPAQSTIYRIQQERRSDGVLPYPFEITPTGLVANQSFWKGDPLLLIGFEDPSPEARDANRSTSGHGIAVYRAEFLDNPDSVVGLYPVFTDFEDKWASWTTPVASVSVHENVPAKPSAPKVLATFMSVPDDTIDFTIDVSACLHSFPNEILAELSEAGWYNHAALERLLNLAALHGSLDAEKALEWLDQHDSGDDTDPARAYVSVMANPQQADAWIAVHRPGVRVHAKVN